MENILLTLQNIDPYNLCIAIVAINMTIIGLTSIAESKSVIGADYSDFLIKKYLNHNSYTNPYLYNK